MQLSKSQIKHIAKLARLDLSDKELKTYGNQLTDILNFVEKLQQVNTVGVEPMAHTTGAENIFREDEPTNWDKQEVNNALDQAPELEDREIKVKRVLQ